MKILVTGVAGFIGPLVARRLLARGDHLFGIERSVEWYRGYHEPIASPTSAPEH